MKHTLVCVLFAAVVLSLSLAGCKRPAIPTTTKGTVIDKGNIWERFLGNARYPDNPREGDDWTRFRDGVQQLSSHFSKPEVIERMRLSADDRKFCERDLGLSAVEISEIEAATFRTADAHYLDECFLLRDAVSKLEVGELAAKDRAELYFRWVMRNILPHEQGDTDTPPAFTLRRGWGSPLERALVFLALLRQTKMEGCLIVVPDSAPLRFLVAVQDGDALRLFDTRLSLPVANKDGKGIATLKEAMDDPALLGPALIAKEDVKKLEAWLVCPLYALAPRMLELQARVSALDAIVLHLHARKLQQDVAKAAAIPVKAWHTNVRIKSDDAVPPTATPTLWLRNFVPKQEGGIDEKGRTQAWARSREPLETAMANYFQVNLKLLPDVVWNSLKGITHVLFVNYEVNTRELHLRGMYDPLLRRQERLHAFVKDDGLVGLAGDARFQRECAAWIEKVRGAYTDAVLADPKLRAKATQAFHASWMQDEFVGWLIDVTKEKKMQDRQRPPDAKEDKPPDRRDEKTILTRILAVGTRDYFDTELARSQAAVSHEKADHDQALLRSQAKPNANEQKEIRAAWEITKNAWANFYISPFLLTTRINDQLKRLREQELVNSRDLSARFEMLEQIHLDAHKYFQARLRLAECMEILDGAEAAKTYLAQTKKEIEALEKDGRLRDEVKNLAQAIETELDPRVRDEFRQLALARINLLARDWSTAGNSFWLKQHIDLRIAGLTNK
jgi:hypothetical protein